jgi:hypothetical protein
MPIDSVDALGSDRRIEYALGVPDVDSHVIELLIIAYTREVGLADSTALQDLGVTIRAEMLGTYFSVSAEDDVIPLIRELSGVEGVGLDGFLCRDAGSVRTFNGPPQPSAVARRDRCWSADRCSAPPRLKTDTLGASAVARCKRKSDEYLRG